MRILAQYEQLDDPRERGALLRREGLYTSHISEWRKARDKGAAGGLAGRRGEAGFAVTDRTGTDGEFGAADQGVKFEWYRDIRPRAA